MSNLMDNGPDHSVDNYVRNFPLEVPVCPGAKPRSNQNAADNTGLDIVRWGGWSPVWRQPPLSWNKHRGEGTHAWQPLLENRQKKMTLRETDLAINMVKEKRKDENQSRETFATRSVALPYMSRGLQTQEQNHSSQTFQTPTPSSQAGVSTYRLLPVCDSVLKPDTTVVNNIPSTVSSYSYDLRMVHRVKDGEEFQEYSNSNYSPNDEIDEGYRTNSSLASGSPSSCSVASFECLSPREDNTTQPLKNDEKVIFCKFQSFSCNLQLFSMLLDKLEKELKMKRETWCGLWISNLTFSMILKKMVGKVRKITIINDNRPNINIIKRREELAMMLILARRE